MDFLKKCSKFGRDNSNGGCEHNISGLCGSNCRDTIIVPGNFDEDACFMVDGKKITHAVYEDSEGYFCREVVIAGDCDLCEYSTDGCRENGLQIGNGDPNNAGQVHCWKERTNFCYFTGRRQE
jgi:hypothetical protein